MRKSKKYIQLEGSPTQKKKKLCYISGPGFFLFYGTYNIRKKLCTNEIDLGTLFFQPFLFLWEFNMGKMYKKIVKNDELIER